MKFDLAEFIAIFLAYAVPIALWYAVSHRVPATWPEPPRFELARPRLAMAAAIGAVVLIFLLNLAYNFDHLLPRGAFGAPDKLVFLANLAIIWSPLALVLLWSRQGLETCLVSLRGLPRKLAWTLAASLVGVAVLLLLQGRLGEPGLAIARFSLYDPIKALQSLIQFAGVSFLLVRVVAVSNRWVGIGLCSALYGLVKYPYFMTVYGMSFFAATGVIAFSSLVAVVVVYMILDRGDVLVIAVLHTFIDLMQQT